MALPGGEYCGAHTFGGLIRSPTRPQGFPTSIPLAKVAGYGHRSITSSGSEVWTLDSSRRRRRGRDGRADRSRRVDRRRRSRLAWSPRLSRLLRAGCSGRAGLSAGGSSRLLCSRRSDRSSRSCLLWKPVRRRRNRSLCRSSLVSLAERILGNASPGAITRGSRLKRLPERDQAEICQRVSLRGEASLATPASGNC